MGYVGEATAQALAGVIHEHPFRKSEVLQVEGELSNHIAIVKLGTVEAIRQGVDGIERPVALFGRKQLIGAESLLGERNQLSGKAVSAGRLCVVGIADLYRLGVIDRVFMSCVYSRISNSIGLMADMGPCRATEGHSATASRCAAFDVEGSRHTADTLAQPRDACRAALDHTRIGGAQPAPAGAARSADSPGPLALPADRTVGDRHAALHTTDATHCPATIGVRRPQLNPLHFVLWPQLGPAWR